MPTETSGPIQVLTDASPKPRFPLVGFLPFLLPFLVIPATLLARHLWWSPNVIMALWIGIFVLAILAGHYCRNRIKRSPEDLRGAKVILGLLVILWGIVIWMTFVLVATPRVRWHYPASTDAMNIRQIGQASLIYANDHRENLPPVMVTSPEGEIPATLHHVAFLLAKHGGPNDADFWISRHDYPDFDWYKLRTVMNDDRTGLNPRFAEVDKLLVDYVTGLNTRHPSTTPIAWTRGLREDGTWDRDGVFGGRGGHIVFMGGNVRFQKNLHGDNQLLRPDGTRTSNILETLPPGTRVVGQGPASLHGRVSPH